MKIGHMEINVINFAYKHKQIPLQIKMSNKYDKNFLLLFSNSQLHDLSAQLNQSTLTLKINYSNHPLPYKSITSITPYPLNQLKHFYCLILSYIQ